MKTHRFIFVCLSLIAVVLLPALKARAATVEVEIRNHLFSPSTVTIAAGDTVRWTQRDTDQHTVTGDVGGWGSSFLSLNQTFSRTFAQPGTFTYHCSPHPHMTGTVIVEQAAPAMPAIAIIAPENMAELPEPGEVTITAEASVEGSTITMVEFFNGETFLGMAHAEPYSVTVELAEGTHSLTAKATSAAGGEATSAVVTVIVAAGSGGTPIENPIPHLIAKGDTTIELEVVLDGLVSPLGMAAPDDGTGRLFVSEQSGVVHVLDGGEKLAEPLLDLSEWLVVLRPNYDERGLLGLAVHPDFENNPRVYTYTSEPNNGPADFPSVLPEGATNNHQSVLAEWTIDDENLNQVDPSSRREIMRIDQPQSNHNGGAMHFGPDGYLYISLGDGGAADDQGNGHSPQGNGQDTSNILGNMVRIDVNARTSPNGQYGVPQDNPFVGREGLDEIYASGFRNPYSWSFDQRTGEMYVADVGQNDIEELNRVFRGGNYGWPIKEGTFYFDPNGSDPGFVTTEPVFPVPPNLVDPIAQYDHDDGLAIVGGYVYRGTAMPHLIGRYIGGELGTFSEPEGRLLYLDRSEFKELRIGLDDRALGMWVKGFGQDQDGEVYLFASGMIGPSGTTGQMLKLVPASHNIEITSAEVNGDNLDLVWSNGAGPFVIQARESLNHKTWRATSATATRAASVAMEDEASLVRVVDMSGNGAIGFTVHLTGAAERPNPVDTPASGSGILSLEGNTLHFDIWYEDLKEPATMAHIHGPALASGAAGILIDLGSFNGGEFGTSGVFSGAITLSPAHKALILEGRTYVNIHSGAHPGGELRGQIAPVLFTAELTGGAERPNPVVTDGNGLGVFLLVGNQLTLNVSYDDLSSTATMAHIHGAAPRSGAAGIMVDLGPLNGGAFGTRGTFNGTVSLDPEELAALVDGLTYVNVHSGNFGGGEIRGQILPKTTAISLSASLTGAAERPTPVETPATGSAIFALEGDHLYFSINYSGLKEPATMAHIHGPASTEEARGILIDLGPYHNGDFGLGGTFSGVVKVTPLQRAYILEGLTYVNVHSGAHPGGEIRGQIAPVVMHSVMLGASERPNSIETNGKGQGTLLLALDRLTLSATYSGLSSTANNAHIHGPADTSGAIGVMEGLNDFHGGPFGAKGSFSGSVSLNPDDLGALIDQRTYINIHTQTNPGGEIRGQIIR